MGQELAVGLGPLEESGCPSLGTLDDLHEFPALFAPLIENLLQRVADERNRRVLPLLHGEHLLRRLAGVANRISVGSSGRILADDIRWARTAKERTRGLLGQPPLRSGQALVISSPERSLNPFSRMPSVHTFGMSYPIDVVFCGGDWLVRHVVHAMAPRRMTRVVFGARHVIEFPAGAIGEDVTSGTLLEVYDGG